MRNDSAIYDNRCATVILSLGLLLLPGVVAWCGAPEWPYFLPAPLLPLLLFRRLRLDAEEGVFLLWGVFPAALVAWREVVRFEIRSGPVVRFEMASCVRRRWDLGWFDAEVQQSVLAFLRERCRESEPPPLSPDDWLRKMVRRRNLGDGVSMIFLGLFCGIGCTVLLVDALTWDARVRDWTRVPGVMRKHERVVVHSGKVRRTVSKIEYEYRVGDRRYTGKRILYDADDFPTGARAGEPCVVLVDPAEPTASAAMFRYRSLGWKLFFRYGLPTALLAGMPLVLWLIGGGIRRRNRFSIPEKLRAYMAAHPAPGPLPPALKLSGVPVRGRPELVDGRRLRVRGSWLGWAVSAAVFEGVALVAAVLGNDGLLWWFAAAWPVLFFLGRPHAVELDLRERRLILGGLWRRTRESALGDLRQLRVLPLDRFLLEAHLGDGTRMRLFSVPEKDLPKLLELLPDIASGMGDLPVGFANSAFER